MAREEMKNKNGLMPSNSLIRNSGNSGEDEKA